MFYGSIVFRFFGVLVVFILRLIFSVLTRKKIMSFSDIWKGPESDDLADYAGNEMLHNFIGFVFVLFIGWLLSNTY